MAEQALKDKTTRGAVWSAIDNGAQFGVTFIVSIVLARLLSPDDYGLLGIVAIFMAVCNALVNGGFASALIRKKNVTEDDYETVFITNLGVSILLYLVIYAESPRIASFFGREELVALTRVASLGIIIGALALVQQTRLTKQIDFKSQTKVSLGASIASGSVGIIMAFIGFGVWALVAQQLVSQTVRTALLWLINKWIPRINFSKKSFKNLFGFGWKIMLSLLLDTIWKELNKVVVGKFYSPADLGQYTRSQQFASLFSQNLTNVVQRVTYPVLSSIQDERDRMVSAYRRILKVTMFITAVGMFLLGAVARPLLYCLIGPQWHDAVTYLPLICLAGSLYPLHAINLNMLQVQGRSDLFLGIEFVKKAIAIVPLAIGITLGILPMLYAELVAGFICYLLNSYYSGKFLGYNSWMQLRDVAPSYFVATIVALSVYFFKYLPLNNWIILFLQIFVGIIVLLIVCEKIQLSEYAEVKSLLLKLLNQGLKKHKMESC